MRKRILLATLLMSVAVIGCACGSGSKNNYESDYNTVLNDLNEAYEAAEFLNDFNIATVEHSGASKGVSALNQILDLSGSEGEDTNNSNGYETLKAMVTNGVVEVDESNSDDIVSTYYPIAKDYQEKYKLVSEFSDSMLKELQDFKKKYNSKHSDAVDAFQNYYTSILNISDWAVNFSDNIMGNYHEIYEHSANCQRALISFCTLPDTNDEETQYEKYLDQVSQAKQQAELAK